MSAGKLPKILLETTSKELEKVLLAIQSEKTDETLAVQFTQFSAEDFAEFKKFMGATKEPLVQLGKGVQAACDSVQTNILTQHPKLGGFKLRRNERCFCGSGRKFKVCHGKP